MSSCSGNDIPSLKEMISLIFWHEVYYVDHQRVEGEYSYRIRVVILQPGDG
jgi:hypothetical protein